MAKTTPLEPGDRVKIEDTANGRKRLAYVRKVSEDGTEIEVWMVKWERLFVFKDKWTEKRRFRLIGRG